MAPGGAAGLAARNRTERTVSHVRSAVQGLEAAPADGFGAAYCRTQMALARASLNEAIAATLTALLEILAVLPLEFPPALRAQSTADAEEVLEAITDGADTLASAVAAAAHARTAWIPRTKPDVATTWITWPVVDRWLMQQEDEG